MWLRRSVRLRADRVPVAWYTGREMGAPARSPMPFVPPKDRFSTHAKSVNVHPNLLRDAVSQFGRPAEEASFERLSGGFMNANYLATIGDERLLVRVYSTTTHTADRECDLLTFLGDQDVSVPRVLARMQIRDAPVALLEFIDGITLEARLLAGGLPPQVFGQIGAQLAAIHRITFAEPGFLGPRLTIGGEYDNYAYFLKQYIERTLSMLLTRPDRLDLDTNEKLRCLIRDRWALVERFEPRRQLVHCDFNPKNLLVSAGASASLLAVIDWEFCLSGNGLGDLGNFFRFEYDYPDVAREAFAAGYRSVAPDLPPDWPDVGRLIDVANMCSFLERTEDYQKSFRTARIVIQTTLTHFGY